jgi:hypothetical protein
MSGKTMLILGIAGVGLATAMFFDTSYPAAPRRRTTDKVATDTPKAVPAAPKAVAIAAPPPAKKQERFRDIYRRALKEKKHAEEQEVIDAINTNAYLGDGGEHSRRMYIKQQAYKKSRRETPIIPVDWVLFHGDG